MSIRIPSVRIYTVNRDSGELEFNVQRTEEEAGEEMSEEQQTQTTDIKQIVVDILSKDSSLCNFIRYIDVGNIIHDSSSNRWIWETKTADFNNENTKNNSQIVRFVTKLDTKFFYNLYSFLDDNSSIGSSNGMDVIRQLFKRREDFYNDRTNNCCEQNIASIMCKMINIDHTFKIKGVSLTALDFINKNPNHTTLEAQFFSNTNCHIDKLIFVGDKCYLLAIMDEFHNFYVSQKTFEIIYKLDTTANKDLLRKIVLNLFNYISKVCIPLLNITISQYVNNDVKNFVFDDLIKDNAFRSAIGNNEEFSNIMTYSFTKENNTDDYIKQNIHTIIEKYVNKYLRSKYIFDNLSITKIINVVRDKVESTYEDLIRKSYMNGLKISKICSDLGWNVFDPDEDSAPCYLNNNHVWIWKEVDITPDTAVIYQSDADYYKIDKYRKLNDEGKEKLLNDYGIHISELYLDLNVGSMCARGRHPNVSSGQQVCMGDLKGKITFTNVTDEQIRANLENCVKLLYCINYSSAYTENGKKVFMDSRWSLNQINYEAGFKSDAEAKEFKAKNSKELIKDTNTIGNDDFEEESEGSTTETIEENGTTAEEVESDDFEEEF